MKGWPKRTNSTTFTANRYNDPVLCPGGVPTANAVPSRDCGLVFQQLQGGNAALKPENSRAWSLGFVVQPTASLTLAVCSNLPGLWEPLGRVYLRFHDKS